jgi:CheY-like chemotaxis protein
MEEECEVNRSKSVLGKSKEEFVGLSREELAQLFLSIKSQKEKRARKLEDMHMTLSECLKLCQWSREDFLPESVTKKHLVAKMENDTNLLPVDAALEAFVAHLNANQAVLSDSPYRLALSATSGGSLTFKKICALEKMLLHLTKCAVEFNSTSVEIKCRSSVSKNGINMLCDVCCNAPGLPATLHNNFFPSPTKLDSSLDHNLSQNLEETRIDASFLTYIEWTELGGKASISKSGSKSTLFSLTMPMSAGVIGSSTSSNLRFPFLKNRFCRLFSKEQQNQLTIKMKRVGKSILIVDDLIVNIKLLVKKLGSLIISESCTDQFSILEKEQINWQKEMFSFDSINDNYFIICASNGAVAYEIAKRCSSIVAIITDDEMPGDIQGIDLIDLIRKLEDKKSSHSNVEKIKMALLYTGESPKHVDFSLLSSLEAVSISKTGSLNTLDEFLNEIQYL